MAALAPQARCTLCGSSGPCFALRYAICARLSKTEKESGMGCLRCLQAGAFEFWHDTEIGVLDEHGLTHVYNHNKVPPTTFRHSALAELRRTPQIVTIQQELWLTHCDDFMAYIGTWAPKDFYAHSPTGDGRALFHEMTDEKLSHLWDSSRRTGQTFLTEWIATYYAFRCIHCGKLRGTWDCD